MTKEQAYKWLQVQFGLDKDHAHIGLFNEYMCDRVIDKCNEVCDRLHTVA